MRDALLSRPTRANRASTELTTQSKRAFDFGRFWFRFNGQRMDTGQANVKAHNRFLGQLIVQDKAKPSWIVSHELRLDQAADAYRNFDGRSGGAPAPGTSFGES